MGTRRFDKFEDKEYLKECVDKILEELDILHRQEEKIEWEEQEIIGNDDKLMRAQALANIDAYFFPDPNTAVLAKDVVAEINTTDERPMRCRPRKLSVVQQAFLQAKTNIMIKQGKLEDSHGQWSHGLVLVAYEDRIKAFMDKHQEEATEKMFKKEFEEVVATFFRLCINLRMLNNKTIPDIFPLPRIDDLVESIPRKCGRFSISDICDAFFTCELKREHRPKTAFKTHDKHLQFAVLPQGFINSPSIFCRLIARTFKGIERDKFSAYIDDVLNHTDDMKEHLETQQEIYNRLRRNKLTLKVAKTYLNQDKIKFLGHILVKGGRYPDPKAVEAILEWRDPTTAKEVRQFLGSTLYYREYILHYSDLAMPLYDLIKKGVIVDKEWKDDVHGEAVKRLKRALATKPVLMSVDPNKPFRLKIDACRKGRGIGCILEQQDDLGKWHPVSCYSTSLNKAEREYSATELECKALHDCILHFSTYLKYIPHFEVFTDHNALKYMVKSDRAITNGRLMRYLMDLQGYNFSLYYRKGTENQDADAVSRLLRTSDEPNFGGEDELDQETGKTSEEEIDLAKKLRRMTIKNQKEFERQQRQMSKTELKEMAEIMDRILAEGVENLESPSGRKRFLENLKRENFKTRETEIISSIEETLPKFSKEVAGETLEFVHQIIMYDKNDDETDNMSENELIIINEEINEERLLGKYDLIPSEEIQKGIGERLVNTVKAYQREKGSLEWAQRKREEITDRVAKLAQGNSENDLSLRKITGCIKKYQLREKAEIDYGLQEKEQPNLNDRSEPPDRDPVCQQLERKRKEGYKQCKVRRSLIENAGRGLYAKKGIVEKGVICSYEGTEITKKQLDGKYGNRDYVASAYSQPYSNDLKYIDARNEDDCYGRFANDPLDDLLVNAKILWHNGKMVLIAMTNIKKGDEIYISYSKDYWYSRLDKLDQTLQARVRRRYPGERRIAFREDAEEMEMKYESLKDKKREREKSNEPNLNLKLKKGMIRRNAITKPPSKNLLTRMKEKALEETRRALFDTEAEEGKVADTNEIKLEDFAHDNVEQCEELADELRNTLEGRKFMDNENGKLYEISRIRFDEEYGMVIGFRKPLHGTRDAEDDYAYVVYGKDGLYELSEKYLLEHPEERTAIPWPLSRQEWADRQLEDEFLREIVNQLRESPTKEINYLDERYSFMEIGEDKEEMVVLKQMEKDGWVRKCMVPKQLQKLTLKLHHEGLSHFGVGRMLATLKQNYHWKTMDKDVDEHVKGCINCKLRKTYQRRARVPIVHYGKTERILDRVHMDLTGPLKKTKEGHNYILVIKDFLSKYVWLIPLRDKTMEEVAVAFVNDFICQAGIPNMVVSDRGNEFVNKIMKRVAKILNIMKVSTTPYNPRADGFVENHNKTLKDQLYHYIDTLKQDDWDIYLPVVQFMYNTTVSLTTGYTPMFLMTGREARMPSNEHMEQRATPTRNEAVDNEFVYRLVQLMTKTHHEVGRKQMKGKEAMDVKQRRPLVFKEYEPGQQVFRVRRPVSTFLSGTEVDHLKQRQKEKVSMKLLERFEGPYEIIRKINPVLYDIEIDGKEVRVHATNMKPY